MANTEDTIAAIASAAGGAARGIVRLSGPGVVACLESCFRAQGNISLAELRAPKAIAGELRIDRLHAGLPCRVYLWPNARSYTRQPAAEVHTLGSPPLLDAALEQLCAGGARLAQPGEFTLRAFLAGRLDLTQAEAVLGVIDAAGRHQLEAALEQLAGGLARPLGELRERLLDLLARLEAGLDFADEEIEFIPAAELEAELSAAAEMVAGVAQRMRGRQEHTQQVRAVLIGAPNVGKSSLFNALAGGAALVSPRAGTTRDYLTARLDLAGVECELIDTAGVAAWQAAPPLSDASDGLWEASPDGDSVDDLSSCGASTDAIASQAEQQALEQQAQAEVQLVCLDSTRTLHAWEQRQLGAQRVAARLLLLTKADQPRIVGDIAGALETSSATGAGLDELRRRLRDAVLALRSTETDVVPSTAVRTYASLSAAAGCLERALTIVRGDAGEELVAAELRAALDELGQVLGAIYTDDILDRIFSRFCIGK